MMMNYLNNVNRYIVEIVATILMEFFQKLLKAINSLNNLVKTVIIFIKLKNISKLIIYLFSARNK